MAKLNAYAVTQNLTEEQIKNTVVNLLNKSKRNTGVDTFAIVGTLDQRLYMVFCDSMVKSSDKLNTNIISLTSGGSSVDLSGINTEIEQLKIKVDALLAKDNTGSDNIVQAGNATVDNSAIINTLTARAAALETKAAALETKAATLETKAGTLETKVSTLESKISTLEADIAQLRNSVVTLQVLVATKDEDVKVPSQEQPSPSDQEQSGGVATPVSNVVYWGVIPNATPTADIVKNASDKAEWDTYIGKEVETGSDEDEGYCMVAIPSNLLNGATPVFTNKSNQFAQVPLNKLTVTIDNVEYFVSVFEYGYGKVPFKLS